MAVNIPWINLFLFIIIFIHRFRSKYLSFATFSKMISWFDLHTSKYFVWNFPKLIGLSVNFLETKNLLLYWYPHCRYTGLNLHSQKSRLETFHNEMKTLLKLCIALSICLSIYLSIHPSIHSSIHPSIHLWLYNLCGPSPLFQFHNLYTVGRTPWTGDQPVARPLPTQRTIRT
jgi:hypothetical protein